MTKEELRQIVYVEITDDRVNAYISEMILRAAPRDRDGLVLRINVWHAVYHYLNLQTDKLTVDEFDEWLTTLTDGEREMYQNEGFNAVVKNADFRKYVMEHRHIGLSDYLEKVLRPDDLKYWNELKMVK